MTLLQRLQTLTARNSPTRISLHQYLALLRIYLAPQWLRVTLMAFFLVASIALQLLGPQLIRSFIDTFQRNADQHALTLTALLYLAVAIGSRLVSALSAYFCEDVGWNATNRLREDLTLHCLKLDRSFHSSHTPGELIERVDSNVNSLAGFFSQFVIQILGNIILMLGVLILMARENIWFGVVLTIYIVISLFIYQRVQRAVIPFYKKHWQAQAELSGFWGELLGGLEDLVSSGATRYILRRYFSLQRQENKTELTSIYLWAGLENVGLAIDVLSTLIMLVLSAYFFVHGAITLGTLVLLLNYNTQLLDRAVELTEQFGSLQEVAASLERINEIYHTQSHVQDGPGVLFSPGPLPIVFHKVSFHYEPSQPVLRDLSFAVAPGETVGLIGRSGSGKTTLTRLLMRFYDPETGSIQLGGHDLCATHLDDLRDRIGLVTQEVQLFHATLRNNLTFFDATISDQRILEAIAHLGLSAWFARLPAGLDTELLGNGAGLSAGEAQLLAYIRVFLKQPQLIILDEATSRLDPATELFILQATQHLLTGRTALIIAHRLSTLEQVDHIMVLDAGQIVEFDRRELLQIDPNSRYSQMLRMSHPEELLS